MRWSGPEPGTEMAWLKQIVWTDDTIAKAIECYHVVETAPGTFSLRDPVLKPLRRNKFLSKYPVVDRRLDDQITDEAKDGGKHGNKQQFECPAPECAKVFAVENDNHRHIELIHPEYLLGYQIKKRQMALFLATHATAGEGWLTRKARSDPSKPSSSPPAEKPTLKELKQCGQVPLAVDKNFFWEASKFFKAAPWHIKLYRFEPAPADLFSDKLPTDLQLMVLDRLEIHEADRLVRYSYPELIEPWCVSLPNRFIRWFENLSAGVNMSYIHTLTGRETRSEIYRLHSLDLHPSLRFICCCGGAVFDPLGTVDVENPPGLGSLTPALFRTFMDLLLIVQSTLMGSPNDRRAWLAGRPTPRVWDELRTQSYRFLQRLYISPPLYCGTGLTRCMAAVYDQANAPFFIPLHPVDNNYVGPDIPSQGPGYHPRRRQGDPFLVLYADELELILRNLEVILRPAEYDFDLYSGRNISSCGEMGMALQACVSEDWVPSLLEPDVDQCMFGEYWTRVLSVWKARRPVADGM